MSDRELSALAARGRISRRDFIHRSVALGVAATTLHGVLLVVELACLRAALHVTDGHAAAIGEVVEYAHRPGGSRVT